MYQKYNEIWFLTSELEGNRASSFRQERWVNYFLASKASVRIFNFRGVLKFSDQRCLSYDEFKEFRFNGVLKNKGVKTSVREGLLAKTLRPIKHYFLAELFLPNVFFLFIYLNKLILQRKTPIALMASSPPFSLALIAATLKFFHPRKVNLTIDMRDAWALHRSLGGIKALKRTIECWVLKKADYLITVSKGLADEFYEFYGVKAYIVYNVATHYFNKKIDSSIQLGKLSKSISGSKILLVYTGSTPEGFYDTTSLIEALAKLKAADKYLVEKIQFLFVGACEPVRRAASVYGLGEDEIVFVQHVSPELAQQIQARASVLIFLAYHGPNNMGVVSTKFFEYLALKKPIFPFDVCEGSDVDLLLKKICGSSLNIHGVEMAYNLLKKIAENRLDILPRTKNPDDLFSLTSSYEDHVKRVLND